VHHRIPEYDGSSVLTLKINGIFSGNAQTDVAVLITDQVVFLVIMLTMVFPMSARSEMRHFCYIRAVKNLMDFAIL
jgi:hypothetical protein